ncbi:SARP family transcriptional regulator [Paractinoplanes rishiriensis]|uniref:SARP family transcriptional regulator n=1 Tax=Paractinoplanes rishiriensis TaxID=1050105 RepID=A0A919K2E5_9ACTN|nr:SARP family transcriptional regulator [Actinoplanes rishiriensis]
MLGPLAVAGDPITAGRDRIVLAMMLLHPDRVLTAAELIDAVWDEQPPSTARGQLQTCVSRLRRALPSGVISTDPAGYRFALAPDELDAAVFGRLVAQARERRDPDLYRRALELWRAPALVEIDSQAVRRAAAVLDEQRAVAIEDWVDLALSAGHDRDLVGELSGLVEQFPLRERLRGQLMVALARAGRQADALAEYRRARAALREELGIEPGRALRELHKQILAGEPPEERAEMIRCLPRTVGDFTGREAAVRRLLGVVEAAGPHEPALAVIDGMAGSGKTTLALHVASLVGDQFPDAHLFVDLHGHSDREPLDPAVALLLLLRQLGIDADRVPPALDERIDLWRNELARRRVLAVLDNAASTRQIAELLPAAPGSLALVTSRRRLSGLDSVHNESLSVFTEDEALAMLARIAGERVGLEPEAAAEVVQRCGGLPLALRLAGARLAHRPRWQVADLVRRIGTSALPELAAEDRTVAGAFALSYGQLAAPAQRLFRLLGLHPAPRFDVLAVAAIDDLSTADAEDLIDDLVDVHLLEEPAPGVFRFHDLLREYATALAAELPEAERTAGLVRALDLALHAAVATSVNARRSALIRDLGRPEPLRPDLLAALTGPDERLERERPALAGYVDAAFAADRPDYGWMLPRAAWHFLWSRGYTDDIETLLARALLATRQTGDRRAEGVVANYLASAHYRHTRYQAARPLLERSIRLLHEVGDPISAANAMCNLAIVFYQVGRLTESVELCERALVVLANQDEGVSPGLCLDALSYSLAALGRYDYALRMQRRRFLLSALTGDRNAVLHSLMHLTVIRQRAGRIAPAVAERNYRTLLRWGIRLPYRALVSDVTSELAVVLLDQGRSGEAMAELRRSFALFRDMGDRRLVPWILNLMGRITRESGDPAGAAELHRRAFDRAAAVPQPIEQGRALLGLGDCLAADDPAGAAANWREARDIFERLQVPERAEAERRLGDPVAVGGR